MGRPDPIEYAERLYSAIRAASFSPLSFLAFGNAVKDGVAMRSIPRIAAEPFMRVVGEMLDLEEQSNGEVIDAAVADTSEREASNPAPSRRTSDGALEEQGALVSPPPSSAPDVGVDKRRKRTTL
ncbi:MAG TPA: hypothetical protein VHJ20_01020 [Polyangia bacterium]|nr:hypothetical protein [Polyangia bacterium]